MTISHFLESFARQCLLVCCATLAYPAYCLPAAPDTKAAKAAKDAQDRMVQSITSHNPKDVHSHSSNGFLKFVACKKGVSLSISMDARQAANSAALADDFMNQFGPAFGVDGSNTANTLAHELPHNEGKVLRIRQSWNGIPIFGSEIVIDVTVDNKLRSAIATAATTTELTHLTQSAPTLLAPEATQRAIEDYFTRKGALPQAQESSATLALPFLDCDSTLVVFVPSLLKLNGVPALAWEIDLRGIDVRYFVDAVSGEVLLSYPLRYDLHRDVYNDNDTMQNAPWLPYPDALGTLERSEGDPASEIEAVNKTYDWLGNAEAFFHDRYGRDSFDGNGTPITASVNYCYLLEMGSAGLLYCVLNPSVCCPWKGAGYEPATTTDPVHGDFFLFGDGIISEDVIAHEYTHAISTYICDLVYAQQSGGICESLSDIFGENIELQNNPGDPADKWLIGEDTPYGATGCGAIRNMKYPTHCYAGIDKASDFVIGMEPHRTSGVVSKLCYLISDGDTFNEITVAPLSSDNAVSRGKAVDLFYEAMCLLPTASDFDCLYYALTYSAEQLGFSETQRQSLEDACQAVEIAPEASFVIKGVSARPLARFTLTGDLIMYAGTVHPLSQDLESSGPAFIVKNSDNNLLLLPFDSGELYIAGKLYTNASGFTEPDTALKIVSGDSLLAYVPAAPYADPALEPESPHTVPAGSVILVGDVSCRNVNNH